MLPQGMRLTQRTNFTSFGSATIAETLTLQMAAAGDQRQNTRPKKGRQVCRSSRGAQLSDFICNDPISCGYGLLAFLDNPPLQTAACLAF